MNKPLLNAKPTPRQLWRWRGVSPQGQASGGSLWAENRAAALVALQRHSVVPLSVTRCRVKKSLWRSQYSGELVQQLATLLQAGLTLSDGLSLLAGQHAHPQWQALLTGLSAQLAQGQALSQALRAWPDVFPPLFPAMIQAGEITGKLDVCCQHLARQQEADRLLAQKVKKALRYPLIVLMLALLVVIGMCGFVLPEFAAIYRTFNAPLPLLTRGVMALSALVQHGLPLIIAGIALPVLLSPLLRRHPRWQIAKARIGLSLPIISSLMRGQKLSQIYTILALTQSAGIPFLQGLTSVEQTLTCPWWRALIQQITVAVTQGRPIWQALDESPVFTPLCRQLIRTGEASGALDRMLENLAAYHTQHTHQQADDLASLLEPVMLLVTGGIIGTLVVAMYLPVFGLGDALGGA